MKKLLAIAVLSIGIMPNPSYGMETLKKAAEKGKKAFAALKEVGSAVATAVPDMSKLAINAPTAADKVKANLAILQTAIRNKQLTIFLTSLSQILSEVNTILTPSANILASITKIPLIKNKVPKIPAGAAKLQDLSKSFSTLSTEVNKMFGVQKQEEDEINLDDWT